MFTDFDTVWTNKHVGGSCNPSLAAAKLLFDVHGIIIRRSEPGAHQHDVENSISLIRAMTNIMLVYMKCVTLNVLSSSDSSRAALAGSSSPSSAFLGVIHDITRFLATLSLLLRYRPKQFVTEEQRATHR